MDNVVNIIGGGLAGCEAALQLAERGICVNLLEMRPAVQTPVHTGGGLGELVCSNSLKTMKDGKPGGMLKREMARLGSFLLECAMEANVPAGGALAVDREAFSAAIETRVGLQPRIRRIDGEAASIEGCAVRYQKPDGSAAVLEGARACIVATGPLTSDALASSIQRITGHGHMAFYDAAAPIVMADSLDMDVLFRQSRYGESEEGDYLNAPFDKEEYERFIGALLDAKRVIARDFEQKDLFSACQPIEEVARSGFDAPRHGMMKPVGLVDPRTGRRPYAAVQLRAENAFGTSYNLVGFQTNLTFPEQRRVFSLVPGLEHAEFARYGVMHRNTFINAPTLLDSSFRLRGHEAPVYFAGQVSGTEGYCEAIMSGLYTALQVAAMISGMDAPTMPPETSFGSLVAYATNPGTQGYQPMHVNFGVFPPLDPPIRNKGQRYTAFQARQERSLDAYAAQLESVGLLSPSRSHVAASWQDFLVSKGMVDAGEGA